MADQNTFIPSAPYRPAALALLCLGLILITELSRLLTIDGHDLSAIWPPGGIMLGASLALGPLVLIPLGAVLVLWLVALDNVPLVAAVVTTLGQVAGALLGCKLIQRYWARKSFQPLTSGVVLYTRGALAAGGLVAVVGTASLFASGADATEYRFYDVFLVYWVLEAVSILLFAPLTFYCLLNPRRFAHEIGSDLAQPPIAVWCLLTLAVLAAITALPRWLDPSYAVGLGFALFALLCWLVVRANLYTNTLAIPLFAIIFVVFSLLGYAGLPELTTIEGLVRSVFLLSGLVILSQMLGSVNADRNRTLETFRQQANTDFLTGLANDRALATQIRSHLAREPEDGRIAWLIHLEVLDFDQIADLMGFRSSRTIEMLLAARLMGTVGPEAHPARIGDGVFAMIGQYSGEPDLAFLYQAFNDQNFSTGAHQTRIRVAVGAVPLHGELTDHAQYLSAAAQAALMARDQLPRIQLIRDVRGMIDNRRGMTERLELIKNALSSDRLVLFAQPICPIGRSEEGISYEILLRMEDENGELLGPGAFLPIAEAFGFMREIDHWVISTTLDALAANPGWQHRTRKCSINLAGTSLSSESLVAFIQSELERTGVDPGKIGFEVTETQRIASRDVAEKITRKLRALGCGVALDDFGTGLASFDYLKSFEFDVLKIDGVFVRDLETSEHDRRIVRATCDVARQMGLKTVAEFVDSHSVANLLGELGVDYGQGFGLGRPVALAALFEQNAERAAGL